MIYVMYMSKKKDFSDLSASFKNYFTGCSALISDENDEELIVSTDAFTLTVTEEGSGAAHASEDYCANFNFSFWFEVISSYTNWANDLMIFVNFVLANNEGDCVLEANGDKPILLRNIDGLFIDNSLGDGSFPFHLIKADCIEKALVREFKGL